jgi:hypothetical protein
MAKKGKGLFGLGSVESDVWDIGKGVAGAVVFDVLIHKLRGGPRREGEEGQPEGPLQGMIEGVEEMSGMNGHAVMLTGAGLLVMQTQYREWGKGMAYIGAYNALISHRMVREWGGGIHGMGNHDVLAAIEDGVNKRMQVIASQELAEIEEEIGESPAMRVVNEM